MIILGKGTVITRDADRPIIYDGAVAIDGTQIVDIGIYDELCKTYVHFRHATDYSHTCTVHSPAAAIQAASAMPQTE